MNMLFGYLNWMIVFLLNYRVSFGSGLGRRSTVAICARLSSDFHIVCWEITPRKPCGNLALSEEYGIFASKKQE